MLSEEDLECTLRETFREIHFGMQLESCTEPTAAFFRRFHMELGQLDCATGRISDHLLATRLDLRYGVHCRRHGFRGAIVSVTRFSHVTG